MALPTFPQVMSVTVLGHLVGRGVARVPITTNPGLVGNRLALAEAALSPAVTGGAGSLASVPCQVGNYGLPLMVPAAFMDAA